MDDLAPRGRLELTWTNKHLRLIDQLDGSYEWVHPADWRVAEVRLLHGAEDRDDRAQQNLLIQGDALAALRSLTHLPEFAPHHVGQVRLAYLDPPFNTGQAFAQYDDALEHSVWLTMLRDRLHQIRSLLSDDGSVWLHLDDTEVHRARCVMDEVFGPQAFVANIVWQKRYSRENRAAIGQVHDHILVYAPMGARWREVRNGLIDQVPKGYSNPDNDPRGPWRAIPITAQGYRPNQMYSVTSPTGVTHTPPRGRCWSMTEPKFRDLEAQGRIYWGRDGSAQPGEIRYLSETGGLTPWTWWPHEEVGHNDEAKKEIMALFPEGEVFATPKPERLLRRIIHVATNPGDTVLDCFVGSGTTSAVAHKMGRRWVGVEREQATVAAFTGPRLSAVAAGSDPGGVTEVTGWSGGGEFVSLTVAPSMFTADEEGRVWLAEWATDDRLAEATAAQMGFSYEPDGPFAGRRGRKRLVVIDGLVQRSVIEALAERLPEGEALLVAGTAVAPDAAEAVRKAAPGSAVRKIPTSILQAWRRTERVS